MTCLAGLVERCGLLAVEVPDLNKDLNQMGRNDRARVFQISRRQRRSTAARRLSSEGS